MSSLCAACRLSPTRDNLWAKAKDWYVMSRNSPSLSAMRSMPPRAGVLIASALGLIWGSGVFARDPSPELHALSAIVGIEAEIPVNARTAEALGTTRAGSGVVIDSTGLVVTIGYLILEASQASILLPEDRRIPAEILGYDHNTGFGLLRAVQALEVTPMRLGDSSNLNERDRVLVSSFGSPHSVSPAIVVARRPFAGYWEYLLENAIFTSPPHPSYGGAALVGPMGNLLGIGSLMVGDTVPGKGPIPGNMFVPIDALKSILGDLLMLGRSSVPARPWLGIYLQELKGRIFITRLAVDGPAADAGLEAGDIILSVGGKTVTSLADFYRKLWGQGAAGIDIQLQVLKRSELIEVSVRSRDRLTWLRLDPSH